MEDAGAHPVLDFVDGGWPSTYLSSLEELLELHFLLRAHAAAQGAAWIVMEIADGLLESETAALLQCQRFTETIDAWLFACGDALAAAGGIDILRGWGIEPVAMSGVISMSPLGTREAQVRTGVPCLTAAALQRGELNERLTRSAPGRVAVAP